MVKVKNNKKHQSLSNRALRKCAESANKIKASTEYTFSGKNMTPFGGLFILSSLVEKIKFDKMLEDTVTVKSNTKFPAHRYILAIIYLLYIGYKRIAHFMYLPNDNFFLRILGIASLPVQSTFWRFLNRRLHKHNELQLQHCNFRVRERICKLANVNLKKVHIDVDPTAETVYGNYDEAKKGYNPKNRGKEGFRPIVSSISEIKELIAGKFRRGETVSGENFASHLDLIFKNLPCCVEEATVRGDSELYSKEVVHKCEEYGHHFIIAVKKSLPRQRKISELIWTHSPHSDGVSEFMYCPQDWGKEYRFVVARYILKEDEKEEQTDLFEDTKYKYRVFVTDFKHSSKKVILEYDGRASIENLIEESKNQVSMSKIPGKDFIANSIFLQLVLLSFNFNRWLQLIGRDEEKKFQSEEMNTNRFKNLYLACKVSDSGHRTKLRFDRGYGYKEHFHRIINRIRRIVFEGEIINIVISSNLIPRYT